MRQHLQLLMNLSIPILTSLFIAMVSWLFAMDEQVAVMAREMQFFQKEMENLATLSDLEITKLKLHNHCTKHLD